MLSKCIFFAVMVACNGQLADFIPQVSKTARDAATGLTNELTNSPFLSFVKASESIVTAAGQTLSWGPLTIARIFGVGNSFPTLISDSNVVESVDSILADFKLGMEIGDADLPITAIVPKYGYTLEEHEVDTEDGYILTLYRIPGNGSVVFLMHGLLGSADDYVIIGPEDGLAFFLAREGYDVWMGNARGNKHSRRHVRLTPADASFWDFSWHEIGTYDVPTMIDYALDTTNQTSLKYIGHSQGSTAFFVMASVKPEYNEKISLMIAMAPVAYTLNVRSPLLRLLAPGTPLLHGLIKSIGLYEFLPDDTVMRTLKAMMCGGGILAELLCTNIAFLAMGFGFTQLNFTTLPAIVGHIPSGASAKQFVHYGQGVLSGDFRQFDYGSAGNSEKYGSETPPRYPLDKITAPVALFYSESDWLASPSDVNLLYSDLNRVVHMHKVPYEQFSHLDFVFGKDVGVLVNNRLKTLMKRA